MSKSPDDDTSEFNISPPRRPAKPTPSVRAGPTEKYRTVTDVDTEFHYYRTLLKLLVPCLSRKDAREFVLPWIHRFSQPTKTKAQREKFNCYLMMLCLMAMRDDIDGMFLTESNEGPLSEIFVAQKHRPRDLPQPAWSTNLYWDAVLDQKRAEQRAEKAAGTKKPVTMCSTHGARCPINPKLRAIGETLDQHFKFFIHLAAPYAAILPRSSDRLQAAKWLKALCEHDPKTTCGVSKAIRNDYMMALMGFLRELQLLGPFLEDPPDPLPPIAESAATASELHPQTDPAGSQADKFLRDMAAPENGAFAFMILSNDLYEFARK
jgi:Domain of unknown function (DUF4485)